MDEEPTRELLDYEEQEWNVYREEVREELVDSDALNPEEEAFMRGYEDA